MHYPKALSFLLLAALCTLPPGLAPAADKAPAKIPSREEMMAIMAKVGAPTEPHKRLAALAGDFKVVMSCKMPGEAPMSMQGTNTNQMILGDRWLQSTFAGKVMDKDFKGIGLLGYDNAAKRYVGMWVDDMSTTMTYMEGTADPDAKVITLISENVDPVLGQKARARHVYTLNSNDSYKFEMYCTLPGESKEALMMEITYTRSK